MTNCNGYKRVQQNDNFRSEEKKAFKERIYSAVKK